MLAERRHGRPDRGRILDEPDRLIDQPELADTRLLDLVEEVVGEGLRVVDDIQRREDRAVHEVVGAQADFPFRVGAGGELGLEHGLEFRPVRLPVGGGLEAGIAGQVGTVKRVGEPGPEGAARGVGRGGVAVAGGQLQPAVVLGLVGVVERVVRLVGVGDAERYADEGVHDVGADHPHAGVVQVELDLLPLAGALPVIESRGDAAEDLHRRDPVDDARPGGAAGIDPGTVSMYWMPERAQPAAKS